MDDYDKPRKRHKTSHQSASTQPTSPPLPPTSTKHQSKPSHISPPTFPLSSFFHPARLTRPSRWLLLPSILLTSFLFRWSASFWPYSGHASPPLYGDFEAQRHWMELTIHLPITEWYFYDLRWWGLDYPPLTAYHSWLCGQLGHRLVGAQAFALDASRGFESAELKLFMRSTVVMSELLVYIPALIFYRRQLGKYAGLSNVESSMVLMGILMQPATILIDHVHFQYNTVMLGFTVASMACMGSHRYGYAAAFFVAALVFKQMALFYAPVVFAFLLGACLTPRPNFTRFATIAIVTIASFAILFAPFIIGAWRIGYPRLNIDPEAQLKVMEELESGVYKIPGLGKGLDLLPESDWIAAPLLQVTQAIHRVFPFDRGLYEDKVANVWCALNVAIKLRTLPQALLQRVSAVATLLAALPACIVVGLRPRPALLPWALATCSWAFFLLGFQVHEKSVLLPLLPMTLLLATRDGMRADIRSWVGFANTLGSWTLFPLLSRVGLKTPYAVLTLLWAFLLGLPPTSLSTYWTGAQAPSGRIGLSSWSKITHLGLYCLMVGWHAGQALIEPPTNKPDLWIVINVSIGAAGFGLCYLWCLWGLIDRSGLLPRKSGMDLELRKIK